MSPLCNFDGAPRTKPWFLYMTHLRQSTFVFGFAGFIRLQNLLGAIRCSRRLFLFAFLLGLKAGVSGEDG